MEKKEKFIIGAAIVAAVVSGILHFASVNPVLAFAVAAAALALLAMIVGDATEQLGSRMGPGATGILQSGLGNLPELFVAIFALRAGLAGVVQAALVGSVLGNSLLVFGLALFFGGIRNGTQRFKSEPPRMIVTLMLLAVSALIIPTLAKELHTPAEPHIDHLDIFVAVILLVLLAASVYFSVKGDASVAPQKEGREKVSLCPHHPTQTLRLLRFDRAHWPLCGAGAAS